MKDLQPFERLPKCLKCGHASQEFEYCWLTDGREYIKVRCEKCGYSWNMKTADADKKELILEEKKSDMLPVGFKGLRPPKEEDE